MTWGVTNEADRWPRGERELQEIFTRYLPSCRWFGGKGRTIRRLRLVEDIPMAQAHLWVLEVDYTDGAADFYLLPLSLASPAEAKPLLAELPHALIARFGDDQDEGILYDGLCDEEFRASLLNLIVRSESVKGKVGEVIGYSGTVLLSLLPDPHRPLPSRLLTAEQSNSSILYGDLFFLKLYRRLEEGVHPEVELIKFLTEKTSFSQVPPFAGALEWRRPGAEPVAVGLLQRFVPHVGDAWTFTLAAVSQYLERVSSRRERRGEPPEWPASPVDVAWETPPTWLYDVIGREYLEMAGLLGQRTAQLHLALASASDDPHLTPEPFSSLDQQLLYRSMRDSARRVLRSLARHLNNLPEPLRAEASVVLASQADILHRLHQVRRPECSAMKLRIHGDYHLGQVLLTESDCVIIDFEGEPARPLSERRSKRSPLQDVAGMIRSFHYAGYGALFLDSTIRPEDVPVLEPWAELWSACVSGRFLRSYRSTMGAGVLVPSDPEEFDALLQAFLLDKAVYELGYELNHRPDWLRIPIRSLRRMLSPS